MTGLAIIVIWLVDLTCQEFLINADNHSIKSLYDAGLLVDVTPSDDPWISGGIFAFQCRIAKPSKDLESSHGYYNDTPIEDMITNLDFPLQPSQWLDDAVEHTNKWIFWVWKYMPGPGPTDFVCTFSSVDVAVATVLDFYFGVPTIIEEWVFPLHRHPELQFDAVRKVIAQAIPIVHDRFVVLEETRRKQARLEYPHGHSWKRTCRCTFLRVSHRNDPTLTLRIRRDLQEAYIVTAPIASANR